MAYWMWFAAAAVLLILETFAPGAAFMWFGFSALMVGLLHMIAPDMPLWLQLLLFATLAAAFLFGWKRWRTLNPPAPTDLPLLNQRDQQLVGRVLTLETPIHNGRGQARVNDSLWLVEGADQAAGVQVRVVRADGTMLFVEPI